MSDAALKAATEKLTRLLNDIAEQKSRISAAQSMIARFDKEVADLDHWIATWHKLSGTEQKPTPAERIEIGPATAKRLKPKNPDRELVVDTALEIIRERGEPVNRKDLFDALAMRGLIIRGKDPEMVLSTMLWRSPDKIVRLPPHGYWPKGVDCKPANYYVILDDLLDMTVKEPEGGVEVDEEEDDEMSDDLRDALS